MTDCDGYDLEMIHDFLDQLLWEVRVSHFDNTNGKPSPLGENLLLIREDLVQFGLIAQDLVLVGKNLSLVAQDLVLVGKNLLLIGEHLVGHRIYSLDRAK
jgi:hypothetical protein